MGSRPFTVFSDTGNVLINALLTAGDIQPNSSAGLRMLKLDGTPAVKIFATGTAQFYSNVLADANLTVAGTLFYKPYVAFRLQATAITQNTGQVATANISVGRPNGTNGVYAFTFPAHPSGVDYQIIVQPFTGSSGSSFYICTANNVSSTLFNIWCRTAANAIIDGSFYVYTVP